MQSTAVQTILPWLDKLAPPLESESREDRRRARLLVAAALFGSAMLFVTSANTLWLRLDPRPAVLNFAWGVTALGVLLFTRRYGSIGLLANALVTLFFVHTLTLSTLAGGRNVGALFAFSVYPLVAVLVAGWRTGLVFTALSMAAVLVTPNAPIEWLARSGIDPTPVPGALIRDALNVTVAVGFMSAIYDAVRSSTLRDARQAQELAEAGVERARLAVSRQRQLIEISRRLQDVTFEDFDAEMQLAMEHTAQLAGADRTVLRLIKYSEYVARFSFGEEPGTATIVNEDLRAGTRTYSWARDLIGQGRIGQVRRLADLPAEAESERAYLEERGVVSWLCVPIWSQGNAIGYQSFETTRDEKTWDEAECASLRLLTELLSSAVLRHRTEQALRESEGKFAGAFRNHPDAMFIMDLETDGILECNDQWLNEMAASTREEVMGRTPWELDFKVPPDQFGLMKQMLLAKGRTPAVEVPVLGRNGDHRTYLISATRIDVNGRPCALANVHDLTSRKQLEQQLLHAQKMEAVGRLAGGVAHDFNNMLTVISGYSSSLTQNLEGELKQDAEEIHHAARRSAELTRQLLAFSRRQILQTEVIDANEVVTGLESMLRPLIGESVELRIDLSEYPSWVRTDRGQLEQAIVNLVVNARDAMPEGGKLGVETRRVVHATNGLGEVAAHDLDPGPYVVLAITDQGKGIDPELAEHVMEPFYTTKPEGEGTGLGLPMAHGVARQCGGTLVLQTEPGRGTRAEIHLPVADAAEAGHRIPGRTRPDHEHEITRRVLLVEDEPTLRRLAARTLRVAGYEVVEADNGESALERAAELGDGIDLVLSDVVMPKVSGIELVRRLREERPHLPVVLMSGYPAASDDGAAIPEDLVFVQKPFEPSVLLTSLQTALEGKTDDLMPVI